MGFLVMDFRWSLILAVLVSVASMTNTSAKKKQYFLPMTPSNVTTTTTVSPLLPWEVEEYVDDLYLEDLELASPHLLQSLVEEARSNQVSIIDTVRNNFAEYIDDHARALREDSSGRTFAGLEVALLSLAFLTFAVFLIDLVQDLFNGSGRRLRREAPEAEPSSSLPDEESTTDLIVLVLNSIDTVANGGTNPDCGQKLLCHLNSSGWNAPGVLGEGANYLTSALLSVFSGTKFAEGLEAAQIGREEEDCKTHFPECPSVIRGFIPANEEQSHPTDEKFDENTEEQ